MGASAKKPIVLSGIQPSGNLMLGNYLGALRSWAGLQQTHECIYCIVDLHAITVPQDPAELRARTRETLAIYLASGIDPRKSLIFVQSQVPEHAELAWILGCHTWLGELERMTQFKDKSAKKKSVGAGLFFYPVLMAADILLYQANLVPVGHDQKQHIELARDIAIRMNGMYAEKFPGPSQVTQNKEVKEALPLFVVPEPFIPAVGARIMSLQEPTAKMSKSDPIPNATVFLGDSDDEISRKIKKAVTDSGTEIAYTGEKPGVKNLISIQSAITGKAPDEIVASYAGKQYGHLKAETAEIVVECIRPLREKFKGLLADRGELDRILKKGADAARVRAAKTMEHVKEALGFLA
ncbi:MAG: tryptophan--tRNA ligase [Deltaproteobacteria bacterium]|nr:tryptophan--tRNA ligase [Deltaproteobacteria bacterium]